MDFIRYLIIASLTAWLLGLALDMDAEQIFVLSLFVSFTVDRTLDGISKR